jgi:hypothetical protein
MTARTWARRLFARTPRTSRKEPARFRLYLEALEHRLAQAMLTVNSMADTANATDGYLSLREAIAIVNSPTLPSGLSSQITGQISGTLHANQTDSIVFDHTQVTSAIILAGTRLELTLPTGTAAVTIDGGAAGVTVDGNHVSGVFQADGGVTATLNDLTISNGYNTDVGGGINNGGTLTLTNCTLSGNSGAQGGGIQNGGTLTVSNCTLSGNSAWQGSGGGINNVRNHTLIVTNCTLSGNSSRSRAGEGILNHGTLTLNNSIVANNGFDIDSFGGTVTGSHDLTDVPVPLAPLANNGGPTPTMALLPGSPAIGGVPANTSGTPSTDQRGFSRITTAATDIGAFEVQPTDSTVALTASPGPSFYGQAVTLTAAVSLTLSRIHASAGTITFLDGSTVLQSGVAVNASGQATYSTTELTVGTHNLLAVYSGATGFLPATGAVSQVVNQATPSFSNLSAPTITYGTATTGIGGTLGTGAPFPTGSVTITLGGVPQQATLHSDGSFSASFDTHALAVSAGGYAISFAYTGDSGYGPATGSSTLTVTRANAVIVVTPYTSATTTYDGNPHTASGTATGVNGEGLSGLNLAGTTHTSAGNYPGDAWTFTDTTGNYNNASGMVNDSIAKANAAIVVTAYTSAATAYDGTPHTATGTAAGVRGEGLSGLNLTGTTHTNAGNYPGDAWTFTDTTGNYNNANGTVNDSIAQARLNVTANDLTIIQGEALPTTDTVRYNGFVPGEDASVLGGSLMFSTTAPNNNTPGTYAITPRGLTSGNYQIHFFNGMLTVLSYANATTRLQAQVDGAGLAHGIQSSLDDQLQAAIASFAADDTTAGVNQLRAFIHHVRAQSGHHIDAALADAFIAYAQRIINAVG